MELIWIAAAYGAALVASALLTPLSIRMARTVGAVDLPHARKVHASPTPRLGGVAIAMAVYVVVLPLLVTAIMRGNLPLNGRAGQVLVLLAAGGVMLLVGLADDIWSLKASYKLLAMLAAAAAVCGSGTQIDQLTMSSQTLLTMDWWLSWPVTMLWLAGVVVSINFIDGLDGLAAGIVAIGAGVLAVVLALGGDWLASVLVLALLGSLTGFLFYNFNPARVFMGDSGAMFIGFTLAGCAVLATESVGTMKGLVLPALALSVPILDTAATMLRRRVLQRRSIFAAERGHIHHRLLALGLGQKNAVLLLYGITLTAVGVGAISQLGNGWATLGGLALLVPLLVGLFRGSGSVRVRETLAALRRNRMIDRTSQQDRKAFEEMQLAFAMVQDFAGWWAQVCIAAEVLGFNRVRLPVVRRDGTHRAWQWCREGSETTMPEAEQLNVVVPIRHRRMDAPLRAEVLVPATPCLETAGRRVALFSRLMEEYSLARIPDTASAVEKPVSARPAKAPAAHAEQDAPHGHDSDGHRNGRGNGHSPAHADQPPAAVALGESDTDLRVAVVHDFLYTYAGAERVLEQILNLYPQADLFSLFDFLPEDQRGFIQQKPVRTSLIQRLPFAKKKHRLYLPLMPLAIEQLDVSDYDLVISSSYVAAKGVITRPEQLHVCYCHTPVRFAWDLQHQYLGASGIRLGLKSLLARAILHYIRTWDVRSANGVDVFVSNSEFVGRRIRKVYRRNSRVVYPPVDCDWFTSEGAGTGREEFYVTASRLVQYKRVDLLVEAFNRMPERQLIVVGDGPELEKLRAMAGKNVRLVGHQPPERLRTYLQLARGFLFAAEEDFGIVPVEAQACGTPVIAYRRGGVTESVIEGETGLFFDEQSCESVMDAVERFEARGDAGWDRQAIRRNAERFASERFREQFAALVTEAWTRFHARGSEPIVLPPQRREEASQRLTPLIHVDHATVTTGAPEEEEEKEHVGASAE